MAYPIHGKVCEVTVDAATANQVGELSEWTIDVELETDEDTEFQDDWKTHLVGLASWSGSMSGSFDPSDTYQKEIHDLIVASTPTGSVADARFQLEDSGDYYSGTIIINSASIGAGIAGKVTAEYGFIGTGALTCTIA